MRLKQKILSALLVILPISSSLCIDMYLPAYSSIAKGFGVTEGAVNLSMSIYLFGLALGQLIYGPVADRFGRRIPLLFGLSLFMLASLFCLISPTLPVFLFARLLQALGACSSIVLCRTIVTDSYHPQKRTSMLALISATNIFSPALAPLFGGYIANIYSWRVIFLIITIFGSFMLVSMALMLGETLLEVDTSALRPERLYANLKRVFASNLFLSYVIIIALLYSLVFSWVTFSPKVLIDTYHVSAGHFGRFFLMPSIGSTLGALFTAKFNDKVRPNRLILAGLSIIFLAVLSLSGCIFGHLIVHPFFMVSHIMIIFFGIGLVTPQLLSDCLALFVDIGGFASGMIGFLQISAGALTGVVTSCLYARGDYSMVILMLVFISLALSVFLWRLFKFRKTSLVPVVELQPVIRFAFLKRFVWMIREYVLARRARSQ